MTRDTKFDWLNETIYEPKAEHVLSPGKPPSHFWLKATVFCLAALMLGAAVASLL
jgi:hypothetical protein